MSNVPKTDQIMASDVERHLETIEEAESASAAMNPSEVSDRLVLLSDAQCVVAWWFVSAAGLALARAKLAPDAQVDLILRLYMEGDRGRTRTIDVDVNVWSGEHRIAVDGHVRQVAAAIGYRDNTGLAHIVRAAPTRRPVSAQREGKIRETSLDWDKDGAQSDSSVLQINQNGQTLNRYVYAGTSKDVNVGLLPEGSHDG
jgi:hypothetical protein